jgi:hypothetical protein
VCEDGFGFRFGLLVLACFELFAPSRRCGVALLSVAVASQLTVEDTYDCLRSAAVGAEMWSSRKQKSTSPQKNSRYATR